MDERGGGEGAGEVRDDADGVRLAHGGDLHHLRDPADVGQRRPDEVDVVVLDQPVEVPAQAPLLAVRQGHRRHLAQLGDVRQRVLVAHGVLDEERVVGLDRLAAAQGVAKVEALMEVDAPVASGSDSLACLPAFLLDAPHDGARIEDVADGDVARSHPERAIARLDGRARALAEAQLRVRPRRRRAREVALAVVAGGASEQLVHRHVQRLALDVPERQVQGAQRVRLLAARRVEPGDVRLLPDGLDPERVLADQRARHLLERVLRAALAEARDAEVGLDRDQHVALIEEGIQVRRPVEADAGDLRLRQVGARVRSRPHEGGLGRGQRLEEGSTVHRYPS